MEEMSDVKRGFTTAKMCRTCLVETEDEMQEIFLGSDQEPDALTINQILLQLSVNVQVFIDQLPFRATSPRYAMDFPIPTCR